MTPAPTLIAILVVLCLPGSWLVAVAVCNPPPAEPTAIWKQDDESDIRMDSLHDIMLMIVAILVKERMSK